jgi:diacylglycerol kinase family enzyme
MPLKSKETPMIIVNPNSGGGLTGRNWESLHADIRHVLGGNVKVALSKKPGDATAIAKRHLKRSSGIIVAVGGDGTINEVANGFFEPVRGPAKKDAVLKSLGSDALPLRAVNPRAAMAIIPSGTRNVLAKSLGMPEGAAECCRALVTGNPKMIDVISATVTSADYSAPLQRIFLNAAKRSERP